MNWKPTWFLPEFQPAQRDITLYHSLCGAPDMSGHSVSWTKTVRLEKAPQDWVIGLCEEESRAQVAASLQAQLRAVLMPRTCSFPSSCSAWGAAHAPQPTGNPGCAWQAHLEFWKAVPSHAGRGTGVQGQLQRWGCPPSVTGRCLPAKGTQADLNITLDQPLIFVPQFSLAETRDIKWF